MRDHGTWGRKKAWRASLPMGGVFARRWVARCLAFLLQYHRAFATRRKWVGVAEGEGARGVATILE